MYLTILVKLVNCRTTHVHVVVHELGET